MHTRHLTNVAAIAQSGARLPDTVRLCQGDSVGRWVERFTPVGPTAVRYAFHEEDHDLPHLSAIKYAAAAKTRKAGK